MIPTLAGRVQTRLFVLATVGVVLTALLTLLLPMSFADAYLVLLAVAVVGVGWELLYHLLMQFRWDKDWPTMFGLLTAVPEGLLMWVLLDLDLVPGVEGPVSWWAFAVMFTVVWLGQWLFVNGPMRVLFVKWRLRGGRLL
ncbi:hypothetical protein [Nonomuraea sp. SYSU D8015]|uniref:hypothetical protein n=1 Tax=Nonomuraea sp. SYSU D8015 TaxID=2593644 RepID=UPI0016617A0F|nr:hypothetical protein [Nonomuraea sp. SYSU D8015]